MAASPYKVEGIALARDTLTNLDLIRQWTPDQRRQIVEMAQAILQADRAHRLDLDPGASRGPARIVAVPLAVFQAGPRRCRHRALPQAPHPFTPGDAA
jgi:hypothetical protein